MTQASASHVAMFRGAIALLWADGHVDDAERAKIKELIQKNMNLSDQQKEVLYQDIDSPHRVSDVWETITSIHDRAHLLNIAQMLFWQDGVYSHDEREVYDKLYADYLATLDVQSQESEIKLICQTAHVQLAKEERKRVEMMMPHSRFFYYVGEKLDSLM